MANLEVVPCGICQSTAYSHLFDAKDYTYENSGAWPVAKCMSCGVVFMNPRLPPLTIGEYYPQNYYANSDLMDVNVKTWRRSAKDLAIKKRFSYAIPFEGFCARGLIAWALLPYTSRWTVTMKYPSFVTNGRVLDVGCGNGQRLQEYRRLGWETHGIEISSVSATVARSAGHQIVVGELNDARYPDSYFDAVTMWDSLEHIHNPAATICEIYRILRPRGALYISVPNYGSWYGRKFADRWLMFTAPVHYFHYSAATLTYLLSKSKFEDVRVKYPLGDAGIRHTLLNVYSENTCIGRLLRLKVSQLFLTAIDFVAPSGHLLSVARKPEIAK